MKTDSLTKGQQRGEGVCVCVILSANKEGCYQSRHLNKLPSFMRSSFLCLPNAVRLRLCAIRSFLLDFQVKHNTKTMKR